jgi:hypothetical protein
MRNLYHHFRFVTCFFVLSFLSFNSKASHIVGTDLRYEWVSGDTYKIIVAIYADCGPASSAAFSTLPTGTPKVCVYNGSTAVATLTLAIEPPTAGLEVTPNLCPGVTSQCTNPSSAMPGIKLFIYSTTYTLPSASPVWRFVFNGNYGSSSAGRAGAITNLMSASTMQLVDTLNNTTGHNSNPVLNVIPLPYYGANMYHTYNPAAVDAEGDSLVYSLTSATNGSGACATVGGPVTYSSATSYAAPLQTSAGGFAFSSSMGQMLFYPNISQRGVVVYNISEYRGGVLVGSIQRELTVLVLNGGNQLPAGGFDSSTVGTIVDTVHYAVCTTTGAFSVSIHPEDLEGDTITVTPAGLPTGATFNTVNNNTLHPISTLAWNTTSVTPGTYTFYVAYADSSCPLTGAQTIAYSITILPTPCPLTSVSNTAAASTMKIYPNPSVGVFSVELPAGTRNGLLTVYDIYGRVVDTSRISNSAQQSLNLSSLQQGTYMVRVVAGDNIYREKIVISK